MLKSDRAACLMCAALFSPLFKSNKCIMDDSILRVREQRGDCT